jgi:hypothetical protein
MATPEPVDPAVAARIVEWLTAWHRDADPGEDTPYATVTIFDSAGEPACQVTLTRRQANELGVWQAGVASTTSAPWAMAAELRRRIEPTPVAGTRAGTFANCPRARSRRSTSHGVDRGHACGDEPVVRTYKS